MRRLPSWHVGVAVPVRNEEKLLPRCLASIIQAMDELSNRATADIVVAIDSSTDRSLEIAVRILESSGKAVSINAAAVGVARATAVDCLLRNYDGNPSRFWIANTDADCIIPRTWLTDQLDLAQAGVQAFAGTVKVDSFEEHGPEVKARYRSSYLVQPDGSHPHVHGANMGMRADTYLTAGGWRPLETAEDHDLWNRIGRLGVERRSTSEIEVVTSGRRTGRAPRGFAEALAAHNETAA